MSKHKKKDKEPSEGQIAAALRSAGSFGPLSSWLFRNRQALDDVHELERASRDLQTADDETLLRASVQMQNALRNRDPARFEVLAHLSSLMTENPVFAWMISTLGEISTFGLKIYKPNEMLAHMLAETDMTVLAEDVRMPFSSIVVLIPAAMRESAPIIISEDAESMYDVISTSKRAEFGFPAKDQFMNLRARYLFLREEPPTAKWPKTITVGLSAVEFFSTDFSMVDAALVDIKTQQQLASSPSVLFSPCPLIATRIPMFEGKTVEECFKDAQSMNDKVAALESAEEDGLSMMFRLGLNAMMALSFADHTEVPAEMPKILKKSRTFREQRKVVGSEVRLDQSMLIDGKAYARGQAEASSDDGAEGDRSEVRPHWRRGHWRRFAAGVGRKDRIWKWVPAIYVNKHRLLEAGFAESDTVVELKTPR